MLIDLQLKDNFPISKLYLLVKLGILVEQEILIEYDILNFKDNHLKMEDSFHFDFDSNLNLMDKLDFVGTLELIIIAFNPQASLLAVKLDLFYFFLL